MFAFLFVNDKRQASTGRILIQRLNLTSHEHTQYCYEFLTEKLKACSQKVNSTYIFIGYVNFMKYILFDVKYIF